MLLFLLTLSQTQPTDVLKSVAARINFGNEATLHAACVEPASWRFLDPAQISFTGATVRAHLVGVPPSCTSVTGGVGVPCAAAGGPTGYPALFSCAWWSTSSPQAGEVVTQGLKGDFHMEVHSGVVLGIGVFVDCPIAVDQVATLCPIGAATCNMTMAVRYHGQSLPFSGIAGGNTLLTTTNPPPPSPPPPDPELFSLGANPLKSWGWDGTWSDANRFCAAQAGKTGVCSYDEVCPNGLGNNPWFGPKKSTDQWTPVLYNGVQVYAQIGTRTDSLCCITNDGTLTDSPVDDCHGAAASNHWSRITTPRSTSSLSAYQSTIPCC